MSEDHEIVHVTGARGASNVDDGEPIEVEGIAVAPLWERQPYDTPLSYARFVEFFLQQERRPRSLVEAYRLYQASTGQAPGKVSALANAPTSWRYWAAGKDAKGNLILGAKTWAQRAAARDQHLFAISMRDEEELWRTRRREIREMEFAEGKRLMLRSERMHAALLFQRNESLFVQVGDQRVPQMVIYKPGGWGEREIANAAKIASELLRRAADMPTNLVQDDWPKELLRQFPNLNPDEVQGVFLEAFAKYLADRNL